jgi:hypothetical protein
MLHAPASEPPKSGRSRFSKALPAVPDLNKSAVLPPPPQYLPSLPSLPSHNNNDNNAPLPSIPPSSTSAAPTTMSIARKPLRKPLPALSAPAATPAPMPQPEPPSPTDSINSILSAYSRSSGESLVRQSDSARESNVTTSTTTSEAPAPAPKRAPTLPPNVPMGASPRPSPSLVRKAVGGGLAPSPPTKDERFQPMTSPPMTNQNSTADPQLWRRRSRSSSRGMADLKLPNSHGSTASSQSTPLEQASAETPKALPRNPQPQTGAATKGLPGRNIRPNAPAESKQSSVDNNPQPVAPTAKPLPPIIPEIKTNNASLDFSNKPTVNRLPTPEYQKEDVKSPMMSNYVSPVSPASSPEPSGLYAEAMKPSPQTPLGPSFKQPTPAPVVEKPPAPRNPDLYSARSVPNLREQATPSVTNEPLPDPAMSRGRLMNDMPSPRFRDSGDSVRSRARSSSARPGQRRPMEQSRPVPPESDPRLIYSESQGGYLYKGRDGTLYPEMKELREPDAQAMRFPTQTQNVLPIDTICRAAPLKASHYDCFQNHRSMNRRSNRHCPLTCQTCERSDAEDRWTCTFCHVRMCETCFSTFNDNKRDLRRLTSAMPLNNGTYLPSFQESSGLGIMA